MLSRNVLVSADTERVGTSAARRRRGFQRDEVGWSCSVDRAHVIALTLWVTIVCVLLGVATGYRPLKEKILSFEESPWHEV